MTRPMLIFVTDPLCSWCWGTLPEILSVRERLTDEMDFDLMMAGLQIGGPRPLAERETQTLRNIWLKVSATTGVAISGRLPHDKRFIYHSEIPCRAVEVVRQILGAPPWDYFVSLQQSFYLDAQNITDPGILARLAADQGIDETLFLEKMAEETVITITREGFDTAKRLGAHALPSVLLDSGTGPKLMTGGYTTADLLIEDLEIWLDCKFA